MSIVDQMSRFLRSHVDNQRAEIESALLKCWQEHPEVLGIGYRIGEDWDGEVSVFLEIILKSYKPSMDTLCGLGAFRDSVWQILNSVNVYSSARTEEENNRCVNDRWLPNLKKPGNELGTYNPTYGPADPTPFELRAGCAPEAESKQPLGSETIPQADPSEQSGHTSPTENGHSCSTPKKP